MISLPFINTNDTLNQLNAVLEQIAQTHAQLNSYGWGQLYDIGAATIENYPLLWAFPRPSKVNENSTSFVIHLVVMDLVRSEGTSTQQDEVQSDTENTLRDIFFLLRDVYDLEPDFPITISPFTESFNDRVTGWEADITIEVPYNYGICDVPTKD